MEVVMMPIEELVPYENNPRKNDEAVSKVAESIREFGFKVPIIVDKDNVIVAGHTRLKAAIKLRLSEVPVIRADDLSEEQVRAFRLADNKTSEFAEWDTEKLLEELEKISDIDMENFGFVFPDEKDDGDEENPYTDKTNIPQYEITGEVPSLPELIDEEKTKELLEEIENSDLPYNEKEFLRKAAQRHLVFNYRKIAEYYAAASPECQDLMEKSALVIIDYENAILNGYTKLNDKVKKMIEENKGA